MRTVFDLTTSVEWTGNPVGIVRSERAIAGWALDNVDNIVFVHRNPADGILYTVRRANVRTVLEGQVGAVWYRPEAGKPMLKARLDDVSRAFRLRRQALLYLERRRQRLPRERRAVIESVQRRLMRSDDADALHDGHGHRTSLFVYRELFGDPYQFDGSERLVLAGIHWLHHKPEQLQPLIASGTRIGLLCYDIIPALFPHYYDPALWEPFHRNVRFLFRHASRIAFTAARARADALDWANEPGDGLLRSALVPLGAEKPKGDAMRATLPPGLESGRYALFVSTVEPRKGHDLACRVWERLIGEGVPQRTGFKLVFAGLRGQLSDELAAAFDRLSDTGALIYLQNVDDDLLARLYQDAAFSIFPSQYEGYGLPVVESFVYGKPVIASDGGSLPEIVGDFSVCLPARDEERWTGTIRRWISDPLAYAAYAERIRTDYRPVTWDMAAAKIMQALG